MNTAFTGVSETLQEQTSGGFAMAWFCPTEKSLTFTTNGHSSPALLCISGLSVCRLFFTSSLSLLFASLSMPMSTLIAKKMLFIFKLIISVPRLF